MVRNVPFTNQRQFHLPSKNMLVDIALMPPAVKTFLGQTLLQKVKVTKAINCVW